MGLLNKDAIVAASDLATEDVDVPEWGGTVRAKAMTGTERDSFEESCYSVKGKDVKMNYQNLRAKLVARCLIGEDGKRLFGDAEIDLLGAKSAKALDKVFTVCQRLNGIGQKEIEDLTGN